MMKNPKAKKITRLLACRYCKRGEPRYRLLVQQTVIELVSFEFWQWYFFGSLLPFVGAVLTLGVLVWLYYAVLLFFWPF